MYLWSDAAIGYALKFVVVKDNEAGLFRKVEMHDKLIPAVIGRKVSDVERRIIALPLRLGGMGIRDPTKNSNHEHDASSDITRSLTTIIFNQEIDFSNYNEEEVQAQIAAVKRQKDTRLNNELEEITELVDTKLKRVLELAQENGAGSWLTALPIQSLGYTLNKQEFRDSVCLIKVWLEHTEHPQLLPVWQKE